MNRIKLFAFVLLACVALPRLAAAQKVACVDLQRALEETEDGKKAKDKLKKDFDRKQKELNDKQDELKKMKDAIDKKRTLMKPEAIAKDEQDLQQRFVELQQTYARLQQELAQKEQEATRGIFAKMQGIVAKIADRDHFDLVIDKSAGVVFNKQSLDITNEVIRMYNSSSSGGGER